MLVIRAGQLIDGHGGPPIRDAVVLVEGEKIRQVGQNQEVEVPSGAEVVDATEKTVMPSMVDAHVHVQSVGGPAVKTFAADQLSKSQGFLALRSYSNVKKDLEMGFTAVRTLHTPGYVDVALRDAIDQELIEGPRIRAAGQGLTITGGHMDHGDWAPEVMVSGRTGVCDGPWSCRRAAREQLKRGADVIKINAAGGSYEDLTRPGEQEMTYEEMAASL